MPNPINKVIKILTYSDALFLGGFGFITPIFAIFLTDHIKGANAITAGFAAAIMWIVQALILVPFGKFLDKNKKDIDDLWFIIVGNVLAALVAFCYLKANLPWHIYVLQITYALGFSMNMAGWTAIFTRHIDKGREAYEWGVRGALVGVGTGLAGALGGIIYQKFGIDILFISVGCLILLSSAILFVIFERILIHDKNHQVSL